MYVQFSTTVGSLSGDSMSSPFMCQCDARWNADWSPRESFPVVHVASFLWSVGQQPAPFGLHTLSWLQKRLGDLFRGLLVKWAVTTQKQLHCFHIYILYCTCTYLTYSLTIWRVKVARCLNKFMFYNAFLNFLRRYIFLARFLEKRNRILLCAWYAIFVSSRSEHRNFCKMFYRVLMSCLQIKKNH